MNIDEMIAQLDQRLLGAAIKRAMARIAAIGGLKATTEAQRQSIIDDFRDTLRDLIRDRFGVSPSYDDLQPRVDALFKPKD